MNYFMVVGEHYNRLRNAYEMVDDFHILMTTLIVCLVISQVSVQFFQLVS